MATVAQICDICDKQVLKLTKHLNLVHPEMTTKEKRKMVRSKKPKNQKFYTVCPYINPLNKKPCENYILKSGYVIFVIIS